MGGPSEFFGSNGDHFDRKPNDKVNYGGLVWDCVQAHLFSSSVATSSKCGALKFMASKQPKKKRKKNMLFIQTA